MNPNKTAAKKNKHELPAIVRAAWAVDFAIRTKKPASDAIAELKAEIEAIEEDIKNPVAARVRDLLNEQKYTTRQIGEIVEREFGKKTCDGHPAGPHDPMGQTVFCDGSCKNS
jgi:hypothetical protein